MLSFLKPADIEINKLDVEGYEYEALPGQIWCRTGLGISEEAVARLVHRRVRRLSHSAIGTHHEDQYHQL